MNEIDVKKLTILIRSGLIDSKDLVLVKRIIKKINDGKKINVMKEREILIELLNNVLSLITNDRTLYQKTKLSILNEKKER